MSLGGDFSQSLNDAVTRATNRGIVIRGRGGQQQRQRLQLLAVERGQRDHGRRDDVIERVGVVLELRNLRRHPRTGVEHHVRLDRKRHGDEHDQRHVDGVASRGRRGGALSLGQSKCERDGCDERADHERDQQCDQRSAGRDA